MLWIWIKKGDVEKHEAKGGSEENQENMRNDEDGRNRRWDA